MRSFNRSSRDKQICMEASNDQTKWEFANGKIKRVICVRNAHFSKPYSLLKANRTQTTFQDDLDLLRIWPKKPANRAQTPEEDQV